MRIIFMGTPDFAQKSLKALYESGNEIIAVVTNQDKPKGRGMKLIASPVKEYALEKNLKVYQPIKIRKNMDFINEIKSLNPDLLCVVAYGKILPKELLDIPKYGAINVHGSLLPKYRGAAPIQWAVLNGDKETGITTMFMDEGMDTGDMILKEKVIIREDETTGELWERMSSVGAKLLVETVNKLEEVVGKIKSANKDMKNIIENKITDDTQKEELKEEIKNKIGAEKQEGEFTIAPMLEKEMALIDWNKSAKQIKDLVRGLNPIMGAYSFLEGKKIKIWKVKDLKKIDGIEDDNMQNGEVIISDKKKGLFIKTANGIIEVLEIQGENSKKMDIKSFLNGNQIKEKVVFSNKIL